VRLLHWLTGTRLAHLGFLTLTAAAVVRCSGSPECYEWRSQTDSSGSWIPGKYWKRTDTAPEPVVYDTIVLESVPGQPLFLTDSEVGWFRVSLPNDSAADGVVWRLDGDTVVISNRTLFHGADYRLGFRGDTLRGHGIWTADVGETGFLTLTLVPLPGGCTRR
jgi:hypothetical protein